MSTFDLVYQAAKVKDAKTIALLRLNDCFVLPEQKGFGITPAAQLAIEGDWESAYWLITEFERDLIYVLYGAVLGGHIRSLQPPLDELPDKLQQILKLPNEDSTYIMLKAFAQRGDISVIKGYLDAHSFSWWRLPALCKAAAYGNQVAVIDLLLEKFPKENDSLLDSALTGAAWGNHETLVAQLYNRVSQCSAQAAIDARYAIFMGVCSSGQRNLFSFLKKMFGLSRVLLGQGLTGAFLNNQDDFVKELLDKDKELSSYAQQAAALTERVDFIETRFTEEEIKFDCIVYFIQVYEDESLFNFLINFSKPEYVKRLCEAVPRRESLNQKIKNLPLVQENALTVVELKSRYCIATKQALYLHKNPEILSAIISGKYEEEGVYNLVKNHTHWNKWQIAHMFQQVVENHPKFLLQKEEQDKSELLVGQKHRLFTAPSSKSASTECPKHECHQETAVKDGTLQTSQDALAVDDDKTGYPPK